MVEGEVDDAVGGVLLGVAAFGARDAGVVGGEGDAGLGGAAGGYGDEVVEGEGLVERRERVETVRACRADGEAEVDLAEGSNARGHAGLILSVESTRHWRSSFVCFSRMIFRPFRFLLLLGFLASSVINVLQAQQPSAGTFDFEQAREPLVKLDGLWRFHPGDDPQWAEPGFDDSGWAAIRGGKSWDKQGYEGLTGYAWYRARVVLPAGTKPLALYIPNILTDYQVFVDGTRLQGCGIGKMDRWADGRSVVCDLPQSSGAARPVTLAIRVWRWPYVSYLGAAGMTSPMGIGERSVVEGRWRSAVYAKSWSQTGRIVVATLTLLASVAALLLFLFRRDRYEYLWFGIMSALDATSQMQTIHFTFLTHVGVWQIVANSVVSYLDLIASMLFYYYLLRGRRNWLFWLAVAGMVAGLVVGLLQIGELVSVRALIVAMDLPTVLAVDLWMWALVVRRAIEGDTDARLIIGPTVVSSAGTVITAVGWVLYFIGVARGLPTWPTATASWPFPFSFSDVMQTLFLMAMLAILIYRFSRSSAQEQRLAGELAAAQAVQSILIPEEIPKLPGFAIESVYRPANEVGGDFFQVLPTSSGGVLAVIGDVSGKGMPAAMIVSLLVGTVRTLAESTDSPAEILDGLNRRLIGRSSGFTTCLILRADPDGTVVVANAGHLPPYVNGREVEVGAGLVLGISAEASYEETVFQLDESARLTLFTDGVVEARSRTGELYGFERAAAVAGAPAAEIAAEAQAFGQEDDITVVSVTRAVALEGAMV